MKMDYETYFDKVYGCWLGKCICGSIGAPLEGCKQLFDYKFDPEFWKITWPNDDLELQILWLNVIEKYGFDIDSDDLARAFLDNVPYNPGEYAYFKRNYRRAIHPPTSGTYNNHYYSEGMGCCIRAEIWACLAAGDPALAAKVCRMDGQLDHTEESILSECFIAAIEAAAFVESDIDKLIAIGLQHIPESSRLARLVHWTLDWCNKYENWRDVRREIIANFGHPDCTNMFQNIGFTIMALKKGRSIEETTMIALNSGFDTDCSCGIAGAIWGITQGAKALQRDYGITDTGYVAAFELHRPNNTILQLSEDIARLTLEAEKFYGRTLQITDVPAAVRDFRLPQREREFTFQTRYENAPVIDAGGEAECQLTIFNHTAKDYRGAIEFTTDAPLEIEADGKLRIADCGLRKEAGADSTTTPDTPDILSAIRDPQSAIITIPSRSAVSVRVAVTHRDDENIADKNIVKVRLGNSEYEFGFAGAVPWKIFGPYWDNFQNVPQFPFTGEGHAAYLKQLDFPNFDTALRNYHLSSRAGLDIVPFDEIAFAKGELALEPTATLLATDDLISPNCLGYKGPGVFYLVSEFSIPEDMHCAICIGHSCPFVYWLDGVELARRDVETWWHPEGISIDPVKLAAGRHRAVFKVVRQGHTCRLSINYKRPQDPEKPNIFFNDMIIDPTWHVGS